MTDRYIKIVLTVIAVELLWLGVRDLGTPVSAQGAAALTPVVIRAIDLDAKSMGSLPAGLAATGAIPMVAAQALAVQAAAPLPVAAAAPLPVSVDGLVAVQIDRPVEVVAQQALPVRNVPYTPSERPGE